MTTTYERPEKELNGMPERDDVGKAAVELHDVLARIEQCMCDKRTATARLVQALKRSKRIETKYKGKTFILQHMEEADIIKVGKSKL